jgi:T5SS/PEP-CTERM-associated repeat protein
MMYLWNVDPGLAASFSDASNWTEVDDPACNGTASTIDSGGIALAASDVTLGMSVGQSSTLDLCDAGTTLSAGGLGVGIFGSGRVQVSSGATLETSAADGVDTIGYEAGGNGTVTIEGVGSCWMSESPFVNVGYQGVGVLDVINGGALMMAGYLALDAAFGGTALTTLVGPAASLTAGAGVVVDGGAGRLRVFTGATLTSGGVADDIGDSAGAGQASISGQGATWVENAGSLVVAAPSLRSTLMVSDGGLLLIGRQLQVGNDEMSGNVDVRAGGGVDVTCPSQNQFYSLAVGLVPSSDGTISVEGAGATLDTRGNPAVLGQQGSGTLTVGAGGNVSIGISDDTQIDAVAALALGQSPGGSGVLEINGIGALLTLNGGGFVGTGGAGILIVENDGVAVVGDDPTLSGGFGLDIGSGAPMPGTTRIVAGGTGTLLIESGGTVVERNDFGVGLFGSDGSVTVTAALLAFAGQLIISGGSSDAPAGSGGVFVGSGGTIDALGPTTTTAVGVDGSPAISIGQGDYANGSAFGTLDVTGAGALVETGPYTISVGGTDGTGTTGGGGAGALTVNGGGTVSAAGLVIGAGPGASGLVSVGSSGTLAVAGTITVGESGTGTLALMTGAQVGPGVTVQIGATGGVQTACAMDASETIDFSAVGGTLNIQSPSSFHAEIVGYESGDTLEIAGLMSSSPSIIVAGTTTLLCLGTNSQIDFVGDYGAAGAGLAASLGLSQPAQTRAMTQSASLGSNPSGTESVPITAQTVATGPQMQFLSSAPPIDASTQPPKVQAVDATVPSGDIATGASLFPGSEPTAATLLASDLLQLQTWMTSAESDIATVSVTLGATETMCQSTAAVAASAMDFWRADGA